MSSETSSALSRRRLWLWTATLAFLVRCAYVIEHSSSAFFGIPILDEAFYDSVAKALIDGSPIAEVNPAFRPMLYPAFLAVLYRVADGWGYTAAVLVQHALGIITTVLVADLGRRVFGRVAAGACAGALYALAGPPLYFESQLLNTALFTALVTIFLALPTASSARRWGLWALAGVVLGIAAQARPNVLPVLAAAPLLALWNPWKATLKSRCLAVVSMVAGTFAILALAGLAHAPFFGGFHLLPTSGGVNFYLGNKAGADGMIPRQDRHASYGDRYQDSVQVFSEQVYLEETGATPPVSPRAVSNFWYRKTLGDALEDPARVLRLLGRKALLLLWNHEIPNNKSFHFAAEQSRLLPWLPVRFAVLLTLGCLGLWAAWRRGERKLLVWILLFSSAYAAGIVLFFVNARYRIPLWPALAVLAGGGLVAAFEAVRTRSIRAIPLWVWAAAGALCLVSSVNWLGVEPETPYRDYFFRSLAFQQKGDLDAARVDAQRAVDLAPNDAAAQFQLGSLALLQEDLETAERHLSIATRLLPSEPRVLNNLGIVLERRKEYSRAFLAYLKATQAGPDFSAAWVNLALMELRAGEVKRAAKRIERAEALGDRSVALQCARAFLEIKRGNIKVGQAILAGAIKRDEELAKRLVDEHRRPLVLTRESRAAEKPIG